MALHKHTVYIEQHHLHLNNFSQVSQSARMVLLWTIIRCPDRVPNEETHRLDVVGIVESEAMINSLWQRDHVPFP